MINWLHVSPVIKIAPSAVRTRTGNHFTNVARRFRTLTDVSERRWTFPNVEGRFRTSMDVSERRWTFPNVDGRFRTLMDLSERISSSSSLSIKHISPWYTQRGRAINWNYNVLIIVHWRFLTKYFIRKRHRNNANVFWRFLTNFL